MKHHELETLSGFLKLTVDTVLDKPVQLIAVCLFILTGVIFLAIFG